MMVQVKETELAPLATDDNEERVYKVEYFGNVEYPNDACHSSFAWIKRVADEAVTRMKGLIDGCVHDVST
jgi:hypothetical protein